MSLYSKRRQAVSALRALLVVAMATMGFEEPATIRAATFELTPIDFGDGVEVTGRVTTDGSTGPLTEANFLSWRIQVTSTTEFAFTPANTSASISEVFSDGQGISVITAPDPVTDGGSLAFRGGVRFATQLADFTTNSLPGGEAFYVNGAAFGYLSLNQPDNSTYLAATPRSGATNVFDLVPLDFGDGLTMTGSITTDGTIGALTGDNLLDWKIAIREVSSFGVFNESNSRVFAADGVSTDGQSIFVTNPDGAWAFARWPVGPDITLIQLADFTDANAPGGQSLFTNPFTYEVLTPLSNDPSYIAATLRVPEPNALLLAALGAVFVVVSHWRRTSPNFASTRYGTNVVPLP